MDKKNIIAKVKSNWLPIILFGLCASQIIDVVLTSIFSVTSFLILLMDILFFMSSVYLFMTFKGDFKNDIKRMITILKISTSLCLGLFIFNVFLIITESNLPPYLGFLINAISLLIIFTFSHTDKIKNFISDIEKKSMKEIIFKSKDKHSGDAKLGINQETKQPVILPLKDRYLHMLILGPTGSGKTSRIILPMIYDDVLNEDLGVIVLEPKGDLAEKVYAMAKLSGRKVTYFNPMMKDCPYFNPLLGEEDMVIENLVTTFKMLDNGTKTFFQDNNENLIRRSVKVVKRLYGDKATLSQLETLMMNTKGEGMNMIDALAEINNAGRYSPGVVKDNSDIVSWFRDDYYTGATGQRGGTKTYENTSGVRNQLSKLNANSYLKKVLNPPADLELTADNCIDFAKCLEEGNIITMCSAQGSLRDLGKFLGYFLILQLQTATLSRPGNEDTRRGCMLYIDEFQTYANSGFSVMLEQGRSYRVASHLATQTRAAIGMGSGNMGRDFIQIVSANCRNVVLFHDVNVDDALYYSKAFGQEMQKEQQVGYTRQRGFIRRLINYTGENEQIRYTEKLAARFTDSDIMYGPADEIIYKIIIDMNVQIPGRSKVAWLPWELTCKINDIVAEYNEANVISKSDYNEKVIQIGFDETNTYQGISKIDEDVIYNYQDSSMSSPEEPVFEASNFGKSEEKVSGLDMIMQQTKVPMTPTNSSSRTTEVIDDA